MEAMQYAAWLSVQTGKRFRLPTVDEMKEAEATFVLNTTFYPLQQCPDVGTCGVNADGVRDLWGLVYQWTANDGDVERARAQWKSTPKPQVVVGSLAEFLASLEAKRAKLDTELKELAAFLKFVGNFSNE
jgi:hypothetical protein